MIYSPAVIVPVLLFWLLHASASVIPKGNSEAFSVDITERGANYVEKILIDEENDLEQFHVPAHNGRAEADFLYDFKNSMSVTRVKSKASCYLGPLPENLPKPADLKTGLQMVSQAPSSRNKVIVQKYWAVTEQLDKTILRQEVQDFCGQFPIFRLKEVNSNDGLDNKVVGRTRLARHEALKNIPLCTKMSQPIRGCHPETFLYTLKIREEWCTWWVNDCKFDKQRKKFCEEWEHKFDSLVCFTVRCP